MTDTTTTTAAPRAGLSLDFADARADARYAVVALALAIHGDSELALAGKDRANALSLLAYQVIDAMDRLAVLCGKEADR